MILKSVDVLPHGLINSREKFGASGEKFREFVRWVAERTTEIGEPSYRPILHFDVYGWIGFEIGMEPEKLPISSRGLLMTSPVTGFILNAQQILDQRKPS